MKIKYHVTEYCISQISLEQIFNQLASEQEVAVPPIKDNRSFRTLLSADSFHHPKGNFKIFDSPKFEV